VSLYSQQNAPSSCRAKWRTHTPIHTYDSVTSMPSHFLDLGFDLSGNVDSYNITRATKSLAYSMATCGSRLNLKQSHANSNNKTQTTGTTQIVMGSWDRGGATITVQTAMVQLGSTVTTTERKRGISRACGILSMPWDKILNARGELRLVALSRGPTNEILCTASG
jgi:hypothetical protein